MTLFTLTILSCKAQTIPLEQQTNYLDNEIEIADGTYFKDVNNMLNKYEGTWIGTHNGMAYEFRIEKFTNHFLGISVDELRLRYKITDANGSIIEDTTSEPDDSNLIIKGDYLSETGSHYVLGFFTRNERCELSASLYISVGYDNNPSKMKANAIPNNDMGLVGGDPNCPNGDDLPLIPKELVTLFKQ